MNLYLPFFQYATLSALFHSDLEKLISFVNYLINYYSSVSSQAVRTLTTSSLEILYIQSVLLCTEHFSSFLYLSSNYLSSPLSIFVLWILNEQSIHLQCLDFQSFQAEFLCKFSSPRYQTIILIFPQIFVFNFNLF